MILREALLTSLPEEVRGDGNFTWLSSRDELLANEEGGRRQRTGNLDADWERWAIQLDSWFRWGEERELPRELISDLLAPLIGRLLSPMLQAYYDEAIRIGRRWKQASTRLRWATSARSAEHLDETVRLNMQAHRGEWWSDEGGVRRTFERFLESAERAARSELDAIRGQWTDWSCAVDSLKRQLSGVEDTASRLSPKAAALYVITRIYFLIEQHRRFAPGRVGEATPDDELALLRALPAFLLVIMGSRPDEWHRNDYSMVYDIVRETLYELRYEDARRDWLRKLLRKYGEADPFAAYGPLALPADEDLLILVSEHYSVDGRPSPYLEKWRERLVPDHPSLEPIAFVSAEDDQAVSRAAAWADSNIKRSVGERRRPAGIQSFAMFVRSTWMHDWVKKVADYLTSDSDWYKKGRDPRWDRLTIAAFIEAVRIRLNAQGYTLDPLSDAEFEGLWKS